MLFRKIKIDEDINIRGKKKEQGYILYTSKKQTKNKKRRHRFTNQNRNKENIDSLIEYKQKQKEMFFFKD